MQIEPCVSGINIFNSPDFPYGTAFTGVFKLSDKRKTKIYPEPNKRGEVLKKESPCFKTPKEPNWDNGFNVI